MSKQRQLVSMLFVAYEESIPKSVDRIIEDIKSELVQYCYIRHDKDVDEDNVQKKVHYHIYLRFKGRKTLRLVANMFGIEEGLIQQCQFYKGSVRYFVHYDDLDKYQYSMLDLKSYNINIGEIFNDEIFEKDKREASELKQILLEIKKKPTINKCDLLHYCLEYDYLSTYKKYYQIIRDYIEDYKNYYGLMPKEAVYEY